MLGAPYYRLLDDGDRPAPVALWQPCVVGGVPHVADGRYADELTRAGEGLPHRVRRVRFFWWAPLSEGRSTLESARNAAILWGRAA